MKLASDVRKKALRVLGFDKQWLLLQNLIDSEALEGNFETTFSVESLRYAVVQELVETLRASGYEVRHTLEDDELVIRW